MKKSSRLILISFIIWFFCLLVMLSPFTTGNRISLDQSTPNVYKSPNEDLLLTISRRKAMIFNLDLERKGEFIDTEYRATDISIADVPPTWSQDQRYVILQNEYYIYYLNSNDLSLQYKLFKGDEVGILGTINHYPQYYVDSSFNLHYLKNNSLLMVNPQSGIITTILNISYNNITFRSAEFHKNGEYVSLFYTGEDNTELIVLDLVSNEYIPIEKFESGAFYFAPSEPYLAFTTRKPNAVFEHNLTIYDLQKDTYGTPFSFDLSIEDKELAWSYDSNEILRIKPNSEYGGYERAYTDNVIRQDVLTGHKNLNFEFTRGYIYESSPISYVWLSKSETVGIIDYTGIGSPELVVQKINSVSLTIYTISGFAIVFFGIASAILMVSFYLQRNPTLFSILTNILSSKKEKIEISEVEYTNITIHGFSFLVLYYISASFLNFTTNTLGEYAEQIPITTLDIIYYSFLSFIDVIIITIITLIDIRDIEIQAKNKKKTKITGISLVLILILSKFIQGYSYGIVNPNRAYMSVLMIPILFVAYTYWTLKILNQPWFKSSDFYYTGSIFSILFFAFYSFSLYISVS